MNILEAIEIDKSYHRYKALDNVSIKVPRGSIHGLLGPNGAGKTTLLRIINQIIAPDKGAVYFDQGKLGKEHLPAIGYLPEERGLYKKMKVGEQAIYLARLKGISRHEARNKLTNWFEKMDMMAWWNKRIEELSKGMQQKVQFITTVLHEPKLIIFDEPFSGFDPINANQVKKEILELNKQGTSIIFSTHNMTSVEELCTDISLINNSKVILEGKLDDIRQQFKQNIFRVEFKGPKPDFDGKIEIVDESKDENGTNRLDLKIKNDKAYAIKEITSQVELVSFHEILPGMNEIFIQAVEEESK